VGGIDSLVELLRGRETCAKTCQDRRTVPDFPDDARTCQTRIEKPSVRPAALKAALELTFDGFVKGAIALRPTPWA
jgi:hypothetical protein